MGKVVRKVIPTVERQNKGKEGILIKKNGEMIYDDSWMFCKICHGEFTVDGYPVCENCLQEYKKRVSIDET